MYELFTPIAGTCGRYQISNHGYVKSLYFKRKKRKAPLILRPGDSHGYLTVALAFYDGIRSVSIHRLLAEHFIKNPHRYNVINHKDGNRSNNNLKNIEWCTYSHNSIHGIFELNQRHGVVSSLSIFSKAQIIDILNRKYSGGQKAKDIAIIYNCSDTAIINICAGRRYKIEYQKYISELCA